MFEVAFTLLSLSFLTFMALESNRVLTESTRLRRRLVDDTLAPARARSTVR